MNDHLYSLKLKTIPEKLYHYTTKDNLSNIFLDGKLKSNDVKEVYLTPTLLDAKKFAIIYSSLNNIDLDNYIVLSFKITDTNIDKNNLSISIDHNKEVFLGAEAIVYNGDIYICENCLDIYSI